MIDPACGPGPGGVPPTFHGPAAGEMLEKVTAEIGLPRVAV